MKNLPRAGKRNMILYDFLFFIKSLISLGLFWRFFSYKICTTVLFQQLKNQFYFWEGVGNACMWEQEVNYFFNQCFSQAKIMNWIANTFELCRISLPTVGWVIKLKPCSYGDNNEMYSQAISLKDFICHFVARFYNCPFKGRNTLWSWHDWQPLKTKCRKMSSEAERTVLLIMFSFFLWLLFCQCKDEMAQLGKPHNLCFIKISLRMMKQL